ncbi:Ubiquitin carboxyl-terminal hydrolase MINDY-1, partial [Nowakowskiella sp. JEL0078]
MINPEAEKLLVEVSQQVAENLVISANENLQTEPPVAKILPVLVSEVLSEITPSNLEISGKAEPEKICVDLENFPSSDIEPSSPTVPPSSVSTNEKNIEASPNDSFKPTSSEPSTSPTAPIANVEQISKASKEYLLKQMEWRDPRTGIVRNLKIISQNENGPCPLLALCNVLLLKGEIFIHNDKSVVSYEHLVELLGDYLFTKTPEPGSNEFQKRISDENYANYAQNLEDVMNLIPSLQYGLDVNVKFESPFSFELTPSLIVFDIFGTLLCHGWIADPQDLETYQVVVGNLGSYNKVVESIIAGDIAASAIKTMPVEQSEVDIFLQDKIIQEELFNLVTDQGYLGNPGVVWETLQNVENDSYFFDGIFNPNTQNIMESIVQPSNQAPDGMTDEDFALALSMQEEENAEHENRLISQRREQEQEHRQFHDNRRTTPKKEEK